MMVKATPEQHKTRNLPTRLADADAKTKDWWKRIRKLKKEIRDLNKAYEKLLPTPPKQKKKR